MNKNYFKLYGVIASIVIISTFITTTPFLIYNLYKHYNPKLFIENYDYKKFNSFETWKETYQNNPNNKSANKDENLLQKKYEEYKDLLLREIKYSAFKLIVIFVTFFILSIILFPLHLLIIIKYKNN